MTNDVGSGTVVVGVSVIKIEMPPFAVVLLIVGAVYAGFESEYTKEPSVNDDGVITVGVNVLIPPPVSDLLMLIVPVSVMVPEPSAVLLIVVTMETPNEVVSVPVVLVEVCVACTRLMIWLPPRTCDVAGATNDGVIT
jgi:hypothetical protein